MEKYEIEIKEIPVEESDDVLVLLLGRVGTHSELF